MKTIASLLALGAAAALAASAEPALTIYNQNFAVVRDTVPLDLKAGLNEMRFAGATAHLEPDSVILRDPAGTHALQILEQNYRNDPVSQELLLSLFEGKTIDFEAYDTKNSTDTTTRVRVPLVFESKRENEKSGIRTPELIKGKVIRSGYVPGGGAEQPIIEVDGKLRFSLPGQPLFPDLGDDTVLKPTLSWLLRADRPGKFDGEVSYVTEGFTWEAAYNLVAPEKGDTVDLIGWITMNNQSGKTFENAKIKLMAGDVNKIQPGNYAMAKRGMMAMAQGEMGEPAVSEKSFDEFHLYTVARPTTLRDRETKQVEFVRAEGVKSPTIYVYDGAQNYRFFGGLINDRGYGTESNKKVWVMREFVNAETNHLGLALPKGKLRFYRRNDDGQLEFTGENEIDHTPRDETIRVTTGNSFDLVGERKQSNFQMSSGDKWIDESFEIKLRNHKKEPVEIRVVEHLYRWNNWNITTRSDEFTKKDAQTVEFPVTVKPDEEKTVTYTVHYSW